MKRRSCCFREKTVRELVNPRIQQAWTDDYRMGYPPYGAFTKQWKLEHCAQLDPYNTDTCPYRRDDCAVAYMSTAIDAIKHHPDNVVAYFSQLARWRGADRADHKPTARSYSRTDGHKARGRDLRKSPPSRPVDALDGGSEVDRLRRMDDDDMGVRRTAHRFFSAGELLGRTDLRSPLAARRRDPWETPPDDDGDSDEHLSVPSPVDGLGDEPPS